MTIIKLNNICKSFGSKVILNNFCLIIEAGDLIAITGPSGSGKSTLLNVIGLLEEFDSGNLIIDNNENIKINSKKSVNILRHKISYLFQNFALVDEKTVFYNLELATKYLKKSKQEKKDIIYNALSEVGLQGYEKRKIFELSGGEQQRVAIARLFIKSSKIILADEPTGSLDKQNRDLIFSYLKKLNTEGKTIIVVTHDEYISSNCNKTIYLN